MQDHPKFDLWLRMAMLSKWLKYRILNLIFLVIEIYWICGDFGIKGMIIFIILFFQLKGL